MTSLPTTRCAERLSGDSEERGRAVGSRGQNAVSNQSAVRCASQHDHREFYESVEVSLLGA